MEFGTIIYNNLLCYFYYDRKAIVFSAENIDEKLGNLKGMKMKKALERKGIYQILRVVVIAEIRLSVSCFCF